MERAEEDSMNPAERLVREVIEHSPVPIGPTRGASKQLKSTWDRVWKKANGNVHRKGAMDGSWQYWERDA